MPSGMTWNLMRPKDSELTSGCLDISESFSCSHHNLWGYCHNVACSIATSEVENREINHNAVKSTYSHTFALIRWGKEIPDARHDHKSTLSSTGWMNWIGSSCHSERITGHALVFFSYRWTWYTNKMANKTRIRWSRHLNWMIRSRLMPSRCLAEPMRVEPWRIHLIVGLMDAHTNHRVIKTVMHSRIDRYRDRTGSSYHYACFSSSAATVLVQLAGNTMSSQ